MPKRKWVIIPIIILAIIASYCSRTETQRAALPTATKIPQTFTSVVTLSPTSTPTNDPTYTPTALCVPALDVWVCDRRP
mgnify:CR=1 FL=1